MKYSEAVEKACCILALLAKYSGVFTNDALHQKLQTSPSYLRKITRKLVIHQLISSAQGANGGFELARPMSKITLYDVVDAIDGHQAYFHPSGLMEKVFPDQTKKAQLGSTLLLQDFQAAQAAAEKYLKGVTMAQLIHKIQGVGK